MPSAEELNKQAAAAKKRTDQIRKDTERVRRETEATKKRTTTTYLLAGLVVLAAFMLDKGRRNR